MKSFVVLLAAFLVLGSHQAKAQDSGAPYVSNSIKDDDFSKLDDSSEQLVVDGDMSEAEQKANEEVYRQSLQEANNIRSDIKNLEGQIKSLKSGAERSRKQAELAQKRLDLLKNQSADATHKVAAGQREVKHITAKVDGLKSKQQLVEKKLSAAREQTRVNNDELSKLASENADLTRRLKHAQAQIDQEKRHQKAQREKQSRLAKNNRQLKQNVARAERKLTSN